MNKKTWECKECGKEVQSKDRPGRCSCGAYAWVRKDGFSRWVFRHCSCGKLWLKAPSNARFFKDEEGGDLFTGVYFECDCDSTVFIHKGKKAIKATALFLGLSILLLSQFVFAANEQYIPKNKCIMSYPLNLFVTAKIDKDIYELAQNIPPEVGNQHGYIQTKVQLHKGEQLNLFIKYVGEKTLKGDDGFDYKVDMWRSCSEKEIPKPQGDIREVSRQFAKELGFTLNE